MGLEQGGSQKTFLSVSDGKIARRVQEGTPNAVKKSKKDGTPYYELQWPAVSGFLIGARKRDTDWGANLALDIEDNGEIFSLEMPWSSRYSTGFFTCIPNINPAKKIRFTPYMKVVNENGKDVKKTMLYLSYSDEKDAKGQSVNIPWAYTKDEPNGLPEMKQIKVKGEMVWDDSDRQEFFEHSLNSILLPRIDAARQGVTPSVATQPTEAESQIEETEEDDLGF